LCFDEEEAERPYFPLITRRLWTNAQRKYNHVSLTSERTNVPFNPAVLEAEI
jgi:hypothetical protein